MGVFAPALVHRSQWPLFLLPLPVLFVPSRPVRINATHCLRRMTAHYDKAKAVIGWAAPPGAGLR